MAIDIAVVLVVVMLVGMNLFVWWKQRPTWGAAAVCFVSSGVPFFCISSAYILPLLTQGFLLFLALPLAYIPRRGPKVYHVTSVLLAAAVWLMALGNALPEQRQYAEWRAANPFEPMSGRVPEPKQVDDERHSGGPLWEQVKDKVETHAGRVRSNSLRVVHEDRVRLFERAMGFGDARMEWMTPRKEHFASDLTPPILQPDGYEPNIVSLGDEMPADVRRPFGQLHANSLLDFANPDGWGYVKSRTQVAGFRPHRFSKVTEPIEKWRVRRVELVGLLLHEKPAVYVSEHLPRMDELKRAKTRPPDSFETDGLTAIRGGHDLFARGGEDDVRMVGAIRSVTQCVECHGGSRGDLLGAFSYQLWREGTK